MKSLIRGGGGGGGGGIILRLQLQNRYWCARTVDQFKFCVGFLFINRSNPMFGLDLESTEK